MPPTLVQGQRSTTTFDTETRRVRDVTPAISMLEPDSGPLLTILTRTRKRASTDPKFEWFEDEHLPRFDLLASNLTAVASSMVVTNYKRFRAGDLVRVNKNEVVLVTTTPTTTTVAITRAEGEVSATTATSGDQLHILSNCNEEGAAKRSLLSTIRTAKYNFTQIVRHPFGYTNTAKATKTYAGSDMEQEASKHLVEHKKDAEYILLLGHRKEDTSGTHPRRTSRGLDTFIATNVFGSIGSLTEKVLDDIIRQGYRYGTKNKVCFASPIVMQVIEGFAKSRLQVMAGEKTYGVTLTRYISGGKSVFLNEHPLMMNEDTNDFTGIGGQADIVDIGDLELRYLGGRLAVHNQNIQANDVDAREDEYLSELGVQLEQERKHLRANGITG